MREDDSRWFAGWKEELPSPNRLMPLSKSQPMPSQLQLPSSQSKSSAELAAHSADLGSGDEPARTRYRPRLAWTLELHQRFLDAIAHLGGTNVAVPKSIMEFMNVEWLTRVSVASHLQKYRHSLKTERRGPFASFPVGKRKPSPSPLLSRL